MWLWLLLATVLRTVFYILGFIATIIVFSTFSAKGDPIKKTCFRVNGIILFSLEFISFLLGIVACWALFGEKGLVFQILFTILSYGFNYQQVLWLFELKTEIPLSMLYFSKSKNTKNSIQQDFSANIKNFF